MDKNDSGLNSKLNDTYGLAFIIGEESLSRFNKRNDIYFDYIESRGECKEEEEFSDDYSRAWNRINSFCGWDSDNICDWTDSIQNIMDC